VAEKAYFIQMKPDNGAWDHVKLFKTRIAENFEVI
jgi:hypothetical protein